MNILAKFNSEYTHKPLSGTARIIPIKNIVEIKSDTRIGLFFIKKRSEDKEDQTYCCLKMKYARY